MIFVSAIANEKLKLYGVQFHPEVDLTENGMHMIRAFLYECAKCKGLYTVESREMSCIKYIKEAVGNSKVLVKYFQLIFLIQKF